MEALAPSSFNPLALLLLFLLIALCLLGSKVVAITALLITATFITLGQVIIIAGAHLYFLRIVLLTAWIRILVRGEMKGISINTVDKMFLIWVAFSFCVGFIPKARHPAAVMPIPTFQETLTNRGGFAFDALGTYFLVRCLGKERESVVLLGRFLAMIAFVLGSFMLFEESTGRNIFSVLGVVPEITIIRDGRFRCQGPFTHPIHAGNFGAVLVPLFIAFWRFGKRSFAVVGLAGATVVVITSASSGPLMAWMYGVVGSFFWPLRNRMKRVRRGVVLILIGLHLVMTAPVWWIIAHVGDVVGGGGYWRAKLIDQFVNHWNEWWLIGTSYTAHWSPTGIGLPQYSDKMDLTNQFVVQGCAGGIMQLILFIWVIVKCYQRLGYNMNHKNAYSDKKDYIIWGLGCCLLSFIVAFLSVALSTQMSILYYTLLALIAGLPLGTEKKIRTIASDDSSLN